MSDLTVERYLGLTGLEQLAPAWQALAGCLARPHFNQFPAWYEAYFRALRPPHDKVHLLGVHRNGELVAVAPLMYDGRRRLVRRATLACDQGIYTTDLVVAPAEQPGLVWRALERALHRDRRYGWDVFHAGQGGTMQTSCMRSVAASCGSRGIEKPSRHGYMVIDVAPYGELIDGLKSKFRNNLRRSDRRLRELGGVAFRWIDDPAEIMIAFDTFVSLERSGWKGSDSSTKTGYPRPAAIGLEDWKYAFYSEALRCFARVGAVNMLLVEIDGRAVGGQISLEIGPTNYLLKTTMDESIEGIAIGHLMINELLRKLDRDGRVDQINLLTDYAWHEPWQPRRLVYVDTWIYNRTAVGFLAGLRRRSLAF